MVVSDVVRTCCLQQLAFASWRTDSDRHRRQGLLPGAGWADPGSQSRRRGRHRARCGVLARGGSRQQVHAYRYQHERALGEAAWLKPMTDTTPRSRRGEPARSCDNHTRRCDLGWLDYWWHQPAMVVSTVLDIYDLGGKTIIPFFLTSDE